MDECNLLQHYRMKKLFFPTLVAISSLATIPSVCSAVTQCEVAIIGGGPGGTHTAYKLITMGLTTGNVCLFEMKDHLGGRVGDNYKIGANPGPFTTDGALTSSGAGKTMTVTLDSAQTGITGTGGYRMNFNHYTRTLGMELAALAPDKLALVNSRSFSRLLEVDNPKFNASFPSPNYFTYDNFGIAKEFMPLYNDISVNGSFTAVNNNDMWKKQLCGPQVPLDNNSHPHYELMDGQHAGWGGKTVDITKKSSLDYLEWVSANVVSPDDPIKANQIARYFLDTWRFRADYSTNKNPVSYPSFIYDATDTDGNDAASYLNFNATDYTGGSVVYPIPSFNAYFDVMQTEIEKSSLGKIYLNEQVTNISAANSATGYTVTTKNGTTYSADKVIIAIAHKDFPKIGGDVITAITTNNATLRNVTYGKNGDMYNSVRSTNVVTITQQYGNGNSNTGWWNSTDSAGLQRILRPADATLLGSQLTASSNKLLRTTNNKFSPGVGFTPVLNGCSSLEVDYSCTTVKNISFLYYNGKAVNFSSNTNELPLTDYHDFINVSRSVYNDSPAGYRDWKNLYRAGGDKAVTEQIKQSMRFMYPAVFKGAGQEPTPNPISTFNSLTGAISTRAFSQVTFHEPGWFNLGKGAMANGVTNQTLFAWSLNPLGNEKVYLVGDTWRNDESAWSDAAYRGSIHVLNKYFNAKINLQDVGTIQCINGEIVDPGNSSVITPGS